VLFVIGLGAMGWQAQPESKKVEASKKTDAAPQLAFLVDYTGFGPKESGLISMGWDDGVVVFAARSDEPGKRLQTGTITPEQLKRVMDDLKGVGFFEEHPAQSLTPDQSYVTIEATMGKESAWRLWDEWLVPGYEASVSADAKFYAFVKMWRLSRTVLEFAVPKEFKDLSKDAEAKKRFDAAVGARKVSR
jgi:hypothetical protein